MDPGIVNLEPSYNPTIVSNPPEVKSLSDTSKSDTSMQDVMDKNVEGGKGGNVVIGNQAIQSAFSPDLPEPLTASASRQVFQNALSKVSEYNKEVKIYEKLELSNFNQNLTVVKVNHQGVKLTQYYERGKFLGTGGVGNVYLYARVDEFGHAIPGKKAKVLKFAHDDEAAIDMRQGNKILNGQLVNSAGEPQKEIPGIVSRTKAEDPTGKVALSSLYQLSKVKIINGQPPQPPSESFNFAGQVCFGLKHLHSEIKDDQGNILKPAIAHRDIKPDNIFHKEVQSTDENGVIIKVKKYGIADFDGAHLASQSKPDSAHTGGYVSRVDIKLLLEIKRNDVRAIPKEQIEGFQKSLDVYALGLSIREFISQKDIESLVDQTQFSDGYGYEDLGSPMDVNHDYINRFANLDDGDKAKMTALVGLVNDMTKTNWKERPNAEACFARLEAAGIVNPGSFSLTLA